MNTDEFDYELDEKYIAQTPLDKRDESKLMVLNKYDGKTEIKKFYDIIDYLNPGDVLVCNNTRVIPARLFGHRPEKEEKIEVLLLQQIDDKWECLVKPGKKMKLGQIIEFSDDVSAKVIEITEDGSRILKFQYDGIFEERLDELGNMPLPPYIKEKLEDKERYQTVYSKHKGSAAAPTAGLHFTNELLDKIREKGVYVAFLTLHVGLGTFRPVKVEDVKDHHMHSEYYSISQETVDIINEQKSKGHNIIAVGTTSIRTLETITHNNNGKLVAESGWTDIFIYPGFQFFIVDSLITNFHLPKSTLMMLVSAFSKKEYILEAYEKAKKNDFRFFSFGDAMFIKGGKNV
ncbi:tRNA preQ1(34) S-adenosylmethionine ribosyltransferase-isomerase QueA [uncultured Finegoldia sp.]|uniref:tRNA preQ1(34) S-adenosylmethionine ribosyltransferase-isomerase QueA n=1 Tax=uncultured Finegoldia sp. TaxID=328009 RepID=UPI00261DA091|nr:tRNA preQ1(34) S-adenosylmethionine ribosyltransferase-isomerase QueA [uncultured Finegoldia sp.]